MSILDPIYQRNGQLPTSVRMQIPQSLPRPHVQQVTQETFAQACPVLKRVSRVAAVQTVSFVRKLTLT